MSKEGWQQKLNAILYFTVQ